MVRTQFQLPDALYEEAKRVAREREISLAEVECAPVMGAVWQRAGSPEFARRKIIDTRLALTLRHHGVTEFATANTRHFDGFGFSRVWNPAAVEHDQDQST